METGVRESRPGYPGGDPDSPSVGEFQLEPDREASLLHERIRDAVQRSRLATRDLALSMARMSGAYLYRELGHASMVQYGVVEFGFKPHKVYDLVTLGQRLPGLPRLDQAMERGELGMSKALLVSRIANPVTEEAWVDAALEHTCRDLETLVARSSEGDPPPWGDDALEAPAWVNVSFRMETRHYEQLMRAFARIRRQNDGADLGGGVLLAAMAERVLAATPPVDEIDPGHAARENYRMVVHRCPDCDRAWQETYAGRAEMTAIALELVECDAEVIQGDSSGDDRPGTLHRTIAPTVRRVVLARDEHRCQVPGCNSGIWLDLHHIEAFAAGGSHHPDNLVCACTTHHDLLHQGVLRVERGDHGELRWTRRDGTPFGMASPEDDSAAEDARPTGTHVDGSNTTHVSGVGDGKGQPEAAPVDIRVFRALSDRAMDPRDIADELGDVDPEAIQRVLIKARLARRIEALPDGRVMLAPTSQESSWIRRWALPGRRRSARPQVSFRPRASSTSWP